MTYAPKEGSGALFKNTRKDKDTHPDYRGDAMVNGQHMEIAAWIKEGKNGKFMSLAFKPKTAPAANQSAGRPQPDDSEIPY